MKFKVNDLAIMRYTGGLSLALAKILGWIVKIVAIDPDNMLYEVMWLEDSSIRKYVIHEMWLAELDDKRVTTSYREGSMLYEWQHEADEIKSLREKRDEQLRSLFN